MRAATLRRIAAPVAVASGLAFSGLLVWHTSYAAFTASTTSPSNSMTSGTVAISDDKNGTSLFTATGLKPGSTDTQCVTVTYDGSLPSTVTLRAAYTSGDATTNALAQYLDFAVEEIPVGAGCAAATGTAIDAADTTLATKVATLSPAAGYGIGWTNATTGDQKQYRFTYTLQDDNNAQNKTASVNFVWTAANN